MERSAQSGLPSTAVLAAYNAVPSILWSLLSFFPVSTFCYLHVQRNSFAVFMGVSLLAYALPRSQFRYLELSSRATYRKLGVPLVNRWVQNGTIINGLLQRKYPRYRRLPSPTATAELIRSTYIRERFHAALLVFFLLAGVYAGARGYLGWAALILLTNVLYNLYPVWLQQYLRLRLSRSMRTPTTGSTAPLR